MFNRHAGCRARSGYELKRKVFPPIRKEAYEEVDDYDLRYDRMHSLSPVARVRYPSNSLVMSAHRAEIAQSRRHIRVTTVPASFCMC